MWPTDSAKKSGSGSCSPATSRNLRHCHQVRSCLCSRIPACISIQSAAFTECCTPTVRSTGRSGSTAAGAEDSATPAGRRAKSGVEFGHYLSHHHHSWRVALPLSGDRRIEPQSCGLGYRRAGRLIHCSRFGESGLPAGADQQAPPAATDPACR